MRANFIELPTPVFDDHPAFAEGVEHLAPQALPPELVVKALVLPSGRTPPEHVAFGSCPSRSARFHVAILPGPARIDVERLDLRLLQPVSQEVGDKLPRYAPPSGSLRPAISTPFRFRSVIGSKIVRGSMLRDELFHHLAHLLCSNVALHMQRVDLTRVFIHHAQQPKSPSFHRPNMDEVPAPNISPIGASALSHGISWQAA